MISKWQRLGDSMLLSVLSVILALIIGAIIILVTGKNPVDAYYALWEGSFDGFESFGRTLEKATPLVMTGLAVAFAFKAGLFNIGGQGQLLMGGLIAAAVGYGVTVLPIGVHLPLALLAGGLAGAAFAGIVGVLKVTTGAHEVITTIMLNFVAGNLTDWLASNPWQDKSVIFATTPEIEPTAAIPMVGELPVGFFVAVVISVLAWVYLYRTSSGFAVRTVGLNQSAAASAGISVGRVIIMTMIISGLFAGLGGAIETQGVIGRFQPAFNTGLGFDGITIALLARTHPIGIIPAAILIGAMDAGSSRMQFHAGVDPEIVEIISAVILVLVAAPVIIQILLRHRGKDQSLLQLGGKWGTG